MVRGYDEPGGRRWRPKWFQDECQAVQLPEKAVLRHGTGLLAFDTTSVPSYYIALRSGGALCVGAR